MILDLLTEDQKKLIKIVNYEKNQVLFNEGDKCEQIGIVMEGQIVIETYSFLEKTEIINNIYKGELFGHYLISSKDNTYLGTGYSLNNSRVGYISKNNLLTLLQTNILFLKSYLELISENSILLKQQNKLLAHKNIRDRIMYYLKQHSINNRFNYNSVTNISFDLSLPRPSVSRELSKLEKEGIIKREGKIIYINKKVV